MSQPSRFVAFMAATTLLAAAQGLFPADMTAAEPTAMLLPKPSGAAPRPVPEAADPTPIEGGQIVAQVGREVVLAADVLVGWEDFLAQNADRIPEHDRDKLRRMFMKRQLEQLVDTKLLYADARRTIPADNFPKIEETLGKKFEEDRIPQLNDTTKTSNRAELDSKLRAMGTSLARRKQAYVETVLAHQWLRQKVDMDEDVTHAQLWHYYQQHITDFDYQARARWEEIEARFDKFSTKRDALKTIVEWGNLVWNRRARFADVARKYSHGVTADEGGRYDWTTRGSLRSTVVDHAIFALPVGQLSQILEDEKSFRIVRVIERKEAGRTPFVSAQPEIRRRINAARREQQFKDYLSHLRETTPMWTLFDGDNATQVGMRSDSSAPK